MFPMIKVLYVGDPHFKHTQKDEMESLMGFVHETSVENSVDLIVMLGDLNDSFNVLRTDNLVFWGKWLPRLSLSQDLVVLVGKN